MAVFPKQLEVAKQVTFKTTEGTSIVKMNTHSSSSSALKENSSPARKVTIHFVYLMKGICISMRYMRKGFASMRNSHYSLDRSCLTICTL